MKGPSGPFSFKVNFMIVTTLVFVLSVTTYAGGAVVVDNISTWRDCERLRIRMGNAAAKTGTCTQVPKIFTVADPVQANVKVTPPAITVTPAPVVVQPVAVTIKKD